MKHAKFFIILSAMLSIAFASCKVTETETEYVPVTETETEYVDKTYADAVSFSSTTTDNGVSVSMSTSTEGATIYYTTDGTSPTASSAKYTAAVEVTADTTIKAIAVKSGIENSPVSVAKVSIKTKTIIETKTEEKDTTAPADVTNFTATAAGTKVLLTWTDATDDDIFGYEVSYSGNSAINRAALSSAMESNTILVAPGNCGTYISNLTVGSSYTFTVKTMDTSGNKSVGVTSKSVEITSARLEITLTPGTTETTNQDVSVSIAVATTGSVKKISYTSGFSYNVTDVLESGTDVTSASSFTVSANGSFTVAASDSEGRSEITWITISNIDKTAPAAVTNLAATYGSGTVTVTWTASASSDVDHYLVSYSVDGTAQKTGESVTSTSYEVNNVANASGTYKFTVTAVDNVGNESEESSVEIVLSDEIKVTKIVLDRPHIVYNDTNKKINVTVYGLNFDKIASQSDKTIKIQVGDSSTTYSATINASENIAKAAIIAPSLSSATVEGTDFTICAIVCGIADREHTATLNISEAASASSISLSKTMISVDNVSSGQTANATVSGTNFDAAGIISLQFYSSEGNSYGDVVTVDTTGFEMHQTSFTAEIPVPAAEDTYTLKVSLDGTEQSPSASLRVYGSVEFSSFKIPRAGISKSGNTVIASVMGKNFTVPDVTSSSFAVSCSEDSSITDDAVITISNDLRLSVTLKIPEKAGEYKVTVVSGNKSCEGTFTVKDYSGSGYDVGVIVLADGTTASYSKYTAIDTNNPPVAVVACINDYGAAVGVGLKFKMFSWTASDTTTTGYNTKFTDLNDAVGSNSWDIICSVDPNGSADAETNYPAFNWMNTYNETYKDYLGGFSADWYMPSISELLYMRDNESRRNAIKSAADAIYNLNTDYAASGDKYITGAWSSTQAPVYNKAWFRDGFYSGGIYYGTLYSYDKRYSGKVLAVCAL